jgi:hypothetical protein
VLDFLKANHIDAKVVTKHAVQILPADAERLSGMKALYSAWVDEKDREAVEKGATHG